MWTSVSVCWTWLSLCAVLCVSEGQKHITADHGQTVTLSCEAPSNSSITHVEWTKPDLEPEYVLLYRSKQYDTDNQHPSFKNRVQLQDSQMKDGDVSLVLKNVTINDTGKYECHIIQRETSRTKRATYNTEPISIIYLKVVEPGQKHITAEPGQTVTLPCEAPSNPPIIVVEWTRPGLEPEYVLLYRDNKYDPTHQHPSFKNRVELQDSQMKDGDVSLVLKNVKINDTGEYECHIIQKETSRRKRATDTETISIIYLKVVEPGPTSGGREGGGDTSGGREGGGDTAAGRGNVGLTAGLLVGSGVIFAVAVFLLMRHMKKKNHHLIPFM